VSCGAKIAKEEMLHDSMLHYDISFWHTMAVWRFLFLSRFGVLRTNDMVLSFVL
jgi:hypothetical protein